MNTKRLVVLGIAIVAAGAAALLARGMIGGASKTPAKSETPQVAMSEILVAGANLQPGQSLTQDMVHWQSWPAASVDPSFITHTGNITLADAVKGTVVRQPLVAGQPVTTTSIVHADSAGFMAAMLLPGMRGVGITISTDSSAGGFILPNDRVDVILTQKANGNPPLVRARTIMTNVRVLAVDQTFKQDKDAKTVLGKTATLELTPTQAEQIAKSQDMGQVSLSLRPLADSNVASNVPSPKAGNGGNNGADNGDDDNDNGSGDSVAVIRYGISHANDAKQRGFAQ